MYVTAAQVIRCAMIQEKVKRFGLWKYCREKIIKRTLMAYHYKRIFLFPTLVSISSSFKLIVGARAEQAFVSVYDLVPRLLKDKRTHFTQCFLRFNKKFLKEFADLLQADTDITSHVQEFQGLRTW